MGANDRDAGTDEPRDGGDDPLRQDAGVVDAGVDSGPRDGGIGDSPYDGGPTAWFAFEDIVNGCADEGSLAQEAPPQGPQGDAGIGELQWQDLWLSHGNGFYYNFFDGASIDGEIAGVTIEGRRMIAAANHIFSPLGWVFTGLGVFDVDTHEHLYFTEIIEGGAVVGPVLMTEDPPRAIQAYKRRAGSNADDPVIGIGVSRLDLSTGMKQESVITTPDNDPTFKDGATLTTTGALVVLHDAKFLVSMDPDSGEPYWRLKVDEIEREGGGSYDQLYGVWPLEDGAVYIIAVAVDSPTEIYRHVFRVDACGNATRLSVPEPHGGSSVIWFDGGYAMLIDGDETPVPPSLLVQTADSTYLEPKCLHAVALPNQRFACDYRVRDPTPPYQRRSFLVRFDDDGSNRQELELPGFEDESGNTARYEAQPIAVDDGIVIMQASRSGTRHIVVVSAEDMAILQTFPLEPTPRPMQAYWDENATPLIFDNGKIAFSYMGEIFVYESGFGGLSAIPYPRGPEFGGNHNRGPLALPPAP